MDKDKALAAIVEAALALGAAHGVTLWGIKIAKQHKDEMRIDELSAISEQQRRAMLKLAHVEIWIKGL